MICSFCPPISVFGQSPNATHIDAAAFGVNADGTSDDPAALQKTLDAAGQQGGVVRLPAGKYLVAGSLKIPAGVALVGSNQALVEADGGKLQVQGCSFATPEPSILLGKGLKHAIVTGNNGIQGVTINNQIGDRAVISENEPSGQKE